MTRPLPAPSVSPRDVLVLIPPAVRDDWRPTVQAWKRAGRRRDGSSFDPAQQVRWKAEINSAIWAALPSGVRAPVWSHEALRVDVLAVLPRPKAHKGPDGLDWKTTRPDLDNHAKVVLDSLEQTRAEKKHEVEVRRLEAMVRGAVTYREPGVGGKGGRRALVHDDAQIALLCSGKVYAETFGEARLYVRFRVLDESPELLLTDLDMLTPAALARWHA